MREESGAGPSERFSAATVAASAAGPRKIRAPGAEAPLVTHLCDHLSPGLISFTVIGFFLQLLYHPLPGGSVLERELGHDPAKLIRLRVLHPVQRDSQP